MPRNQNTEANNTDTDSVNTEANNTESLPEYMTADSIAAILETNPEMTREDILLLNERMYRILMTNAFDIREMRAEKAEKEIVAKGTKQAKNLKRLLETKDKDGKTIKSVQIASFIVETLGADFSDEQNKIIGKNQISSANKMLAYLYNEHLLADSLMNRIETILSEKEGI